MSKQYVGALGVENYFPNCDAVSVSFRTKTITVGRQEDGSVTVFVQDDDYPAARVFVLGTDKSYDPHAKAEDR